MELPTKILVNGLMVSSQLVSGMQLSLRHLTENGLYSMDLSMQSGLKT
jgi:hypothetical protein